LSNLLEAAEFRNLSGNGRPSVVSSALHGSTGRSPFLPSMRVTMELEPGQCG
jgi:hypothetical protein